jgi:ATP-dependent HslUV protease subunit HslV
MPLTRATTVLSVRTPRGVAIGGDGQVTIGETVVKERATKIRTLHEGKVWAGFAGSAADAFSLLERFEEKLDRYVEYHFGLRPDGGSVP